MNKEVLHTDIYNNIIILIILSLWVPVEQNSLQGQMALYDAMAIQVMTKI